MASLIYLLTNYVVPTLAPNREPEASQNRKWVLNEQSPQTPSYSSNKAHSRVQARGMSLPDCESKQLVKLTKTCFPLKSQKIFSNSLCWAGERHAKIINTFNLKQVAIWSVPRWLLDLGPFESILVSLTSSEYHFYGPEWAPVVVTPAPQQSFEDPIHLDKTNLTWANESLGPYSFAYLSGSGTWLFLATTLYTSNPNPNPISRRVLFF